MVSPLFDDKGVVRYYIGAQVDVTGLVLDGLGLESFRGFLHQEQEKNHQYQAVIPYSSLARSAPETEMATNSDNINPPRVNEPLSKLSELSMMLCAEETDIFIRNTRPQTPPHPSDGDSMISDACSIRSMLPTHRPLRPQRRIIDASDSDFIFSHQDVGSHDNEVNQRSLPVCYRNYILIRPYPSLQIIFVSPSLRLPGLVRTPFFTKIGGPPSVLASLEDALRDGVSVTARVLWLPKNGNTPNSKARRRWIRCTPMIDVNDNVGVWMVILVPVEVDDYRLRPMTGSDYQSMNCTDSVSNPYAARNASCQNEKTNLDDGDLAAMESLVGGRQKSSHEINGTRPRLQRVTIMDNDMEDSRLIEDSYISNSGKYSNGFVSPRISDESTKYGPYYSSMMSTPTIQEEV